MIRELRPRHDRARLLVKACTIRSMENWVLGSPAFGSSSEMRELKCRNPITDVRTSRV